LSDEITHATCYFLLKTFDCTIEFSYIRIKCTSDVKVRMCVNEILAITGDPSKVGHLPGATNVYDVNSKGLTEIALLIL
jgi:hypothetical protein